MIINFGIQNFGSIKDRQTLSFEATKSTELEDYYVIHAGGLRLLKTALIYGANASGKTTVLKALEFLQELVRFPLNKKTDELYFEPFLFNLETPNQNSLLAIEFIQNKVRYAYEVVFNQKAIVNEELYFFNPNKANIFKRVTDLEKQITEIALGGKIKKDKIGEKTLAANTLWNNTVLGGFLKTNIEIPELKEVVEWFNNRFSPIFDPGDGLDELVNVVHSEIYSSRIDKKEVIGVIKKADLNISDIFYRKSGTRTTKVPLEMAERLGRSFTEEIVDAEFEHTVNGRKYKLRFESESLGTQRYYVLAAMLAEAIRGHFIIPIDELESSLHPDLYTHFLLTFLANAKNSQIIATTHNREILNNRDVFRNDAIWFTEKGGDSATKLFSLADFDTKVIRDTTNVYNAYKTGKLGAVPRLGDYYIDVNHEENEPK